MYTLLTGAALFSDWTHLRTENITGNISRNLLYGFTGAVPTSFSEIPFDTSNPFELMRNCETAIQFQTNLSADSNGGMNRAQGQHLRTHIPTKQPYLDPTYNKWSISPKAILPEQFWQDDRNGNIDNEESTWGNDSGVNVYSLTVKNTLKWDYRYNAMCLGLNHFWNKYRVRDRLLDLQNPINPYDNLGYDYYSEWPLGGRYPYNWPMVQEFEEEITVDSFDYFRGWYSGNQNSPTSVTLDRWDEATETWVDEQTISIDESAEIQYQDLAVAMTGRVFRFRFGDTGGSNLYFGYFRLLTSTPPTARPSTDITWGLVCPYSQGMSGFDDFLDRYSYSTSTREFFTVQNQYPNPALRNKQVPMLLVDIGDSRNPGTTTLTQSTGVEPGTVPELLDFVIDFNDN